MKMSIFKLIFIISLFFAIIDYVDLKIKRNSDRSEKITKKISKFASMIKPEIMDDPYLKNLYSPTLKPESNEQDELILIKALITGVLYLLNVPRSNVLSSVGSFFPKIIVEIIEVLLKFHKTTNNIYTLQ